MHRSLMLATIAGVSLISTASLAAEYPKHTLDAGISGGFADGVGDLWRTADVHGLTTVGGEIGTDIVYGANPRWGFGVYGTLARFGSGSLSGANTAVMGVSGGVQARHHFSPNHRFDPWISLGVGYRGLTQVREDNTSTMRDGVQLARARLGFDFVVAKATKVGPVLGIDGTTFLDTLDSPTVSTFVFAGLCGSFDVLHVTPEESPSGTD